MIYTYIYIQYIYIQIFRYFQTWDILGAYICYFCHKRQEWSQVWQADWYPFWLQLDRGFFINGGEPQNHGMQYLNSLMTWMIWVYPHGLESYIHFFLQHKVVKKTLFQLQRHRIPVAATIAGRRIWAHGNAWSLDLHHHHAAPSRTSSSSACHANLASPFEHRPWKFQLSSRNSPIWPGPNFNL
jgi:hypothetical protein